MDVFLESVRTDFQGYLVSKGDVAQKVRTLDDRYHELWLQSRFNIARRPPNVMVSEPKMAKIPKEARVKVVPKTRKSEEKVPQRTVIRSWFVPPKTPRRRCYQTPVLVRRSYRVPAEIVIDGDEMVDVTY